MIDATSPPYPLRDVARPSPWGASLSPEGGGREGRTPRLGRRRNAAFQVPEEGDEQKNSPDQIRPGLEGHDRPYSLTPRLRHDIEFIMSLVVGRFAPGQSSQKIWAAGLIMPHSWEL